MVAEIVFFISVYDGSDSFYQRCGGSDSFLSLLVVTQIIFNCVLKAAQIIFIRVYGVSDSFFYQFVMVHIVFFNSVLVAAQISCLQG